MILRISSNRPPPVAAVFPDPIRACFEPQTIMKSAAGFCVCLRTAKNQPVSQMRRALPAEDALEHPFYPPSGKDLQPLPGRFQQEGRLDGMIEGIRPLPGPLS